MVLLLFSFFLYVVCQIIDPVRNRYFLKRLFPGTFTIGIRLEITLPAYPVLAFDPRYMITALILLRARLAAAIRVFQVQFPGHFLPPLVVLQTRQD